MSANIERRKINSNAYIGVFGSTEQSALLIDSLVNNDPYTVNQNSEGTVKIISSNNAFKVGYEGNGFRLDAITAYQYTLSDRNSEEFDFTPFDINAQNYDQSLHTISEELRFRSTNDSKLQWIAGLYFYHVSDFAISEFIQGSDNAAFAPSPELAALYPFNQVTKTDIRQYGFSVFGQADYAITDQLTLTAGIRYELEESFLDSEISYSKDGQVFTIPGVFETTSFSDNTFNAVSPSKIYK